MHDRIVDRRRFVGALAAGAAAGWGAASARALVAQEVPATARPEVPGGTMAGDGYIPIQRPPKPGASPSMNAEARDAVERQLSCPCPCTLDVFTCRTSMPCGFSPRMHQDVVRLVDGGYTEAEIVEAFVAGYGEQVRMAPKREGFNLVGYLAPFAALGAGGLVVAALIRRWGRRAAAARVAAGPSPVVGVDATPDELARLDAAVRGDGS